EGAPARIVQSGVGDANVVRVGIIGVRVTQLKNGVYVACLDPGDPVCEAAAEVGIDIDHVGRGQRGFAVARQNQRQLRRPGSDGLVGRVISLRAIRVAILQVDKVKACTTYIHDIVNRGVSIGGKNGV